MRQTKFHTHAQQTQLALYTCIITPNKVTCLCTSKLSDQLWGDRYVISHWRNFVLCWRTDDCCRCIIVTSHNGIVRQFLYFQFQKNLLFRQSGLPEISSAVTFSEIEVTNTDRRTATRCSQSVGQQVTSVGLLCWMRRQQRVQLATLEVRLHIKNREAYWVKLSRRKRKDRTKKKGTFPVRSVNW